MSCFDYRMQVQFCWKEANVGMMGLMLDRRSNAGSSAGSKRGKQRWAAAPVASFMCAGGEPGVKGTLTRNPISPLYNAPAIKAATLPTISIMRRFTVDGMRVSTRASRCSSHSGCSNKIVFLFFRCSVVICGSGRCFRFNKAAAHEWEHDGEDWSAALSHRYCGEAVRAIMCFSIPLTETYLMWSEGFTSEERSEESRYLQ